MTANIELLLNKIKENEEFAQKVSAAKSKEEVQQLAKDADIEITLEEIQKLKESTELTEEELDNASGGCGHEISFKWPW